MPHDVTLLVTAAAVCLASTFGVFRLRARMRHTRGMVRTAWLFLAGLQAGSGVWAAHYLAMLAFQPGLPSGFEPLGALTTLLLAVTGVGLGLSIAWTGRDRMRLIAGSLVIAFTVGATNYLVLGTWQVEARLTWDPIFVWLSVAAGAALTTASLFAVAGARTLRRQMFGAILLGGAILALHALGMRGLSLEADPSIAISNALLSNAAMTFVVVMISVLMILGGLGAAYIDDMASRAALKRMQRLADAAHEGLVVMGADGRVLDCNAAFAKLYGAPAAALTGLTLSDIMALEGEGALGRDDTPRDGWVVSLAGERIPVEANGRQLVEADDGTPSTVLSVRDLREQRAAEDHIRYLAEHDSLTGLPSRAVLQRELSAGMSRIEATGENLLLLCLRVENSKDINTLHGHAAGDALLAKVGERLRRWAVNGALAARLGGNEFALFVFGPSHSETAKLDPMLLTLTRSLRRGFVWEQHVLEPQITIGVASMPEDAHSVTELLMHAESALHAAGEGVDGVSYFRQDLHDAMHEQRALAAELRMAIDTDQLTVYYQPQARAEDGELCGFEALVRWIHPVRGFLPPDKFIPVAEDSGLIGPLGEWVLRQACFEAATWPKPVTIAVNLSPHQVGEADLPTKVHQILIDSGLSPSRLELEITESALFRDYQRALDVLRRLKALGVKIAMDDFGTGFSSLSTLQSFPFDKIKIDKSFVEGVGKLERSTVIVRAVLGIGRGLEIPVVAEGVETAEQMAFLREECCSSVQGYHIGRPGPVASHAALFERAHGAPAPQTARAASAAA